MTVSALSLKQSEPQRQTPARAQRVHCSARSAALVLLLIIDWVDEQPDALDIDLADIARFHPYRIGLARVADAGRSAGKHDVPGLERHALRYIGYSFRDRKHHVVGVVRLHDLPIEPALDLQAFPAGGRPISRDHPGAEGAGPGGILVRGPVRGFSLQLA